MIGAFAQIESFNAMQRSVREHFQEGGSVAGVLLALVTITGVLCLAYLWTRQIERGTNPDVRLNEYGLFRRVVGRLELDAEGKQLLLAVARKSGLKHPSVLLLSPSLFDRYVVGAMSVEEATLSSKSLVQRPAGSHRSESLEVLRDQLFPLNPLQSSEAGSIDKADSPEEDPPD